MASGKSPVTAVHFALMFFVLTTIIFGAAFYIYLQDATQLRADVAERKTKLDSSESARRNLLTQIDELKNLIGHNFDKVGHDDPGNANTVIGAGQLDLKRYARNVAAANYKEALKLLWTETGSAEKKYISEAAEKVAKVKEIADLKAAHQAAMAGKDTEVQTVQDDKTTLISQQTEIKDAQDATIADLEKKNLDAQVAMETEREEFTKQLAENQIEIENLGRRNEQLRALIDKYNTVSFEREDGVIRSVDHNIGLVWINLGSADFLPPRISFSIYQRAHHGIGRGSEEIKGSLEVTRIVGPHLAEARILDSNIDDPISAGDPIYTPIWSPGRPEQFVFAGLIDFKRDNRDDTSTRSNKDGGSAYSDRQVLHDIVRGAGARIVGEVDDNGDRWFISYDAQGKELLKEPVIDDPVPQSQSIDIDVKFLVIGRTPDPTKLADPKKIEISNKIQKHLIKMRREAMMQGVRIVNLNDFLAYVGYKPKSRLWMPGMDTPWNLKSGAASAKTDELAGDRYSSGTVSSIFTRSKKNRKQPTSSGQTSGVGGKSGY